jgi:hypothetical protein
MAIRDFLARLNAFSPNPQFPLRTSPFQQPDEMDSNLGRFLRRLNVFAPENKINIPPPTTPKIPEPTFSDEYLRQYGNFIQNYPQMEPPGKLQRLAAALSGGGASLVEGPTAGASLVQNLLYAPHERRVKDWMNQAQQYQKAAEIEGTSAKNLASFLQQQRKLDIDEAYKTGSLDIRQQRTDNQQRQIELNYQIAREKLAQSDWIPFKEPDKDGNLVLINRKTGDHQIVPVNMMTPSEKFDRELQEKLAVARTYTQGALERKLLDVDINNARLNLQAQIAQLRSQGLTGNALQRNIEAAALQQLAIENPDSVGKLIFYHGDDMFLAARPGYMDEYEKLARRLNEIKSELSPKPQKIVPPQIQPRRNQTTTTPIKNIFETFREVKKYIPQARSIRMDPVHGWIAQIPDGRWIKIAESGGRWFVVEE